ncbi:hypothetical protein [Streptomyces alkaliphilus]|uniref:hypothetical protein n=1 Tax=Streptomyces alkaliphilus TaxID=1472722 RepID=UPI00117F4792|nr:hypothetical protein [Streptomyces alkaliphilus]MQS06421.1 hypothetical protein [Streptomyces alkaliphilus]
MRIRWWINTVTAVLGLVVLGGVHVWHMTDLVWDQEVGNSWTTADLLVDEESGTCAARWEVPDSGLSRERPVRCPDIDDPARAEGVIHGHVVLRGPWRGDFYRSPREEIRIPDHILIPTLIQMVALIPVGLVGSIRLPAYLRKRGGPPMRLAPEARQVLSLITRPDPTTARPTAVPPAPAGNRREELRLWWWTAKPFLLLPAALLPVLTWFAHRTLAASASMEWLQLAGAVLPAQLVLLYVLYGTWRWRRMTRGPRESLGTRRHVVLRYPSGGRVWLAVFPRDEREGDLPEYLMTLPSGPPWNPHRGLPPVEGTTELLRLTDGNREVLVPRIEGRLHPPRRTFVESEGFDEKHGSALHLFLSTRVDA